MNTTVRVDTQGRVVIPQAERERLDLPTGGSLELVPTHEGVLLERRRQADVTLHEDGLPVISIHSLDTVSNADSLAEMHRQRDGA